MKKATRVKTPLFVPARKRVKKSGDILIDPNANQADFESALDTLNSWRSLHLYPISTFQRSLKLTCKSQKFKRFTVAQRLKRLPSILSKLNRFKGMNLARMQDIGGIRVILPDIDSVYRLNGALTSGNKRVSLVPSFKYQDYLQSPKDDGYRSYHRNYEYRSRTYPELDGLLVELQIRTELQHSWATAVEIIDILEKTSLKSGLGSNDHRRFFQLASALFAYKEKTALHPMFEDSDIREIAEEAKRLDEDFKILHRLKSVGITSQHIEDMTSKKGEYHILVLSQVDDKWNLQVYFFKKGMFLEAKAKYKELEENSECADVVFISVGDLKKIKQAYPNYFLNADIFIREMKNAFIRHLK